MSTTSSISAPYILLMIRQRFIFLFISNGCINLCCQFACPNNKPAYHRTVLNVTLIDVVCVHLASTYSHLLKNCNLLHKPLFSTFSTFSWSTINDHGVFIWYISRNFCFPVIKQSQNCLHHPLLPFFFWFQNSWVTFLG